MYFQLAKGDVAGATHELITTVAGEKTADALSDTVLDATKNVINAGSKKISSLLDSENTNQINDNKVH